MKRAGEFSTAGNRKGTMRIKIAPLDEEASRVDFLLCGKKRDDHIPRDYIEGICVNCKEPIIYIRFMSEGPLRICVECMKALMNVKRGEA